MGNRKKREERKGKKERRKRMGKKEEKKEKGEKGEERKAEIKEYRIGNKGKERVRY